MSKISKLLVMALVVLAVITMSLNVNAGTKELTEYVTNYHVINGMMFELTNSQKTAIRDDLAKNVNDSQADTAYAKIMEAEKLVTDSGVKDVANLSADVKSKIISLATDAASAVGLTLKVNTSDNTYTLTRNSKVLASGKVESLITKDVASLPGNTNTSTTKPAGETLLYTGANYAVYAVVVLAIVAVAVVVKKRA